MSVLTKELAEKVAQYGMHAPPPPPDKPGLLDALPGAAGAYGAVKGWHDPDFFNPKGLFPSLQGKMPNNPRVRGVSAALGAGTLATLGWLPSAGLDTLKFITPQMAPTRVPVTMHKRASAGDTMNTAKSITGLYLVKTAKKSQDDKPPSILRETGKGGLKGLGYGAAIGGGLGAAAGALKGHTADKADKARGLSESKKGPRFSHPEPPPGARSKAKKKVVDALRRAGKSKALAGAATLGLIGTAIGGETGAKAGATIGAIKGYGDQREYAARKKAKGEIRKTRKNLLGVEKHKFASEKTARIGGASPPDAEFLAEKDIPYKERRRRYKKYLKKKSKEPPTSKKKALGVGAGVGGVGGAIAGGVAMPGGAKAKLVGAGLGALAGGGLGAGIGHLERKADIDEIKRTGKVLKKKKRIDRDMSSRIFDYKSGERVRREQAKERRHEELVDAIRDKDKTAAAELINDVVHQAFISELSEIEKNAFIKRLLAGKAKQTAGTEGSRMTKEQLQARLGAASAKAKPRTEAMEASMKAERAAATDAGLKASKTNPMKLRRTRTTSQPRGMEHFQGKGTFGGRDWGSGALGGK